MAEPDIDGHLARWLADEFKPRQGRTVDTSRPVMIYRCLRGGAGRYSILQGRHVVGHADRVLLSDVSPVVRAAACRLIVATGRKRVAALLRGYLVGSGMGLLWDSDRRLPVQYRFSAEDGAFVSGSEQLRGARVALLNATGLSAAYTR